MRGTEGGDKAGSRTAGGNKKKPTDRPESAGRCLIPKPSSAGHKKNKEKNKTQGRIHKKIKKQVQVGTKLGNTRIQKRR